MGEEYGDIFRPSLPEDAVFAPVRSDAPPPDQSLGSALAALAHRLGTRGLVATLVVGLAATGGTLWRSDGHWARTAPAVMVAAFAAWGLATGARLGWPVPPAGAADDLAVERVVLRAIIVLSIAAGVASAIVTFFGLAFAIAGPSPMS
jgi:hypothetical protein